VVKIPKEYMDELEWTVHALQKFGGLTKPPAPEYHGFLGSTTNATLVLLGQCIQLAGGTFELLDGFSTNHWQSVVNVIHRSYYSSLQMVVEAMCDGFCRGRGRQVVSGAPERKPGFMDYINSAMKASKLTDDRKVFWRQYFDGLRVLRNKNSHFDAKFSEYELKVLTKAGLTAHISAAGMIQTRPANYVPLAKSAHDFMQELDQN
jgi:hypothetical protein